MSKVRKTRGSRPRRVYREKHTVIEKTSKSLKLHILCAWFIILCGLGVFFGGAKLQNTGLSMVGTGVGGIGVLWLIITKIRIWWNHE
jgi:hypothetical protein